MGSVLNVTSGDTLFWSYASDSLDSRPAFITNDGVRARSGSCYNIVGFFGAATVSPIIGYPGSTSANFSARIYIDTSISGGENFGTVNDKKSCYFISFNNVVLAPTNPGSLTASSLWNFFDNYGGIYTPLGDSFQLLSYLTEDVLHKLDISITANSINLYVDDSSVFSYIGDTTDGGNNTNLIVTIAGVGGEDSINDGTYSPTYMSEIILTDTIDTRTLSHVSYCPNTVYTGGIDQWTGSVADLPLNSGQNTLTTGLPTVLQTSNLGYQEDLDLNLPSVLPSYATGNINYAQFTLNTTNINNSYYITWFNTSNSGTIVARTPSSSNGLYSSPQCVLTTSLPSPDLKYASFLITDSGQGTLLGSGQLLVDSLFSKNSFGYKNIMADIYGHPQYFFQSGGIGSAGSTGSASISSGTYVVNKGGPETNGYIRFTLSQPQTSPFWINTFVELGSSLIGNPTVPPTNDFVIRIFDESGNILFKISFNTYSNSLASSSNILGNDYLPVAVNSGVDVPNNADNFGWTFPNDGAGNVTAGQYYSFYISGNTIAAIDPSFATSNAYITGSYEGNNSTPIAGFDLGSFFGDDSTNTTTWSQVYAVDEYTATYQGQQTVSTPFTIPTVNVDLLFGSSTTTTTVNRSSIMILT